MSEFRRSLTIDRADSLTPEVFHERYLSGLGKPVIITDALNGWGARSKWNFEWFKSHYGSQVVPFVGLSDKYTKVMKLGDYIDYMDAPGGLAKGFWIDNASKLLCKAPVLPEATILYLSWNVFRRHPELLEDIELSPKFVEDWLPFLPEAFRKVLDGVKNYYSSSILIGPQGSGLGLHRDVLHTHAYLAQIVGRKRCVLFSPEHSTDLYCGKVNVDHPDLDTYPLFKQAHALECVLAPGEVLFIPSRWWHHVVALDKSITVNYNFFNRANFSGYITDVIRDLPELMIGLELSADAKSQLGINWACRGFDFPKFEGE